MANETKTTSSRLEELRARYDRKAAHQTFDRKTVGLETRIGRAPATAVVPGEIGQWQREMEEIKLRLAEYAESYGKLNVNFSSLVGKEKYLKIREAIRIGIYNLLGKKDSARQVKLNAAQRRGDDLERLVNRMAEVLDDQYQLAQQGQERSRTLQVEVTNHLKQLDRKLIESLKAGHYKTSDITKAKDEVGKLEIELNEINGLLGSYETEIRSAQEEGSVSEVDRLAKEIAEVLDYKHGVLDGKLAADGVVSEIRRNILDSAEGVQSAKGAIAATKLNYLSTGALIDAFNELEIKYRHAREDFVPVFKHQAKIGVLGEQGIRIREALLSAADISQRLMETNAKLVYDLATKTFDLLQTPLYDPEKVKAVEDDLRAKMVDLNRLKEEWAETNRVLSEPMETPHYARPE